MKRIFAKINTFVALLLAFILVQMAIYLAVTNPLRADLSNRHYYALSEKTLHLLENLHRPVHVYVLFQKEHELYNDIENLLAEYQYRSRNIHVEYVDPARDVARTEELVRKYGVTEPHVVIFEMDGKSRVVPLSDIAEYRNLPRHDQPVLVAFKGEQAFSSALQSLVEGKTPVVYFLVGHGEKRVSDTDPLTGYARIGTAILRDNMEVKELLLTKKKGIPKDAAAVVVAGPTRRLEPAEVEMLEDYLNHSGRLLLMLDALRETNLEPMLRRWGVGLRNDFVIDPENTLRGNDVFVRTYYEHPITLRLRGGNGARFYLPRSVEPIHRSREKGAADRPVVSPLAVTSDKSWSETQPDQRPPRFDPGTGDRKGPICLAVAVERGAPQTRLDVQILPSRMVVFGDSDFVVNNALSGGNQDLFMSALNWLTDRQTDLAIAPKPIEQLKLDLTSRQLRRYFWLNALVIPLFAVVFGLFVWMRRRK